MVNLGQESIKSKILIYRLVVLNMAMNRLEGFARTVLVVSVSAVRLVNIVITTSSTLTK